MFEQLVNEAASRLSLSATNISALMRQLLALMTNETAGGINGFRNLFHRAGCGDLFTSWYGGHEARPIAAQQLETVLGTTSVDRIATSSGLTRTAATSALAFILPRLIAYLTPNGVMPTNTAVRSQVSHYLEPVAAAHRTHHRSGVRHWAPWAAAAFVLLAGLLWLRMPERTVLPQAALHDRDGNVIYSTEREKPPSAVGTSGILPEAPRAIDLAVITFASGSAGIPAEGMSLIRSSAEALKSMPAGSKIEIGGHTDSKGSAKSNVALSQARADAVRNALIDAGAPAAMLTTKGYGDTEPRATNDTEEGRSQNRRIEYVVER